MSIDLQKNLSVNTKLNDLYNQKAQEHLALWAECFGEIPPNRINEFGIINPERYDSDNGILVVAKETNGWSNEAYEKGELFLDWFRGLLHEVQTKGTFPASYADRSECKVKKHPTTWYNIGRWVKLIQNPNADHSKLASETNSAFVALETVAFTNVNKVRGKNHSGSEYRKFSKQESVQELLQEEIRSINPQYILLCGVHGELLGDSLTSAKILSMPHPSARRSKIEMLGKLKEQLDAST